MCVIFLCEKELPSADVLKKGWARNEDGAGIAVPNMDKKLIHWKKGIMEFEQLEAEVQKINILPAIIHLRLQSMGGNIPELTHPFPLLDNVPLTLEGDAERVLFHNGHWHGWRTALLDMVFGSGGKLKLNDRTWSDTRALAMLVHYFGWGMIDLSTVSVSDKIAMFEFSKSLQKPRIYKAGSWVYPEGKGYVQSNDTFCSTHTSRSTNTNSSSSSSLPGRSSHVAGSGAGGSGYGGGGSATGKTTQEDYDELWSSGSYDLGGDDDIEFPTGEEGFYAGAEGVDFFGASLPSAQAGVRILSADEVWELLVRIRHHALKGQLSETKLLPPGDPAL